MLRTIVLITVQIATLSVFADRWANRPGNTISQFLYEDAVYRILFTFYTLLHLAVLYVSISFTYQRIALVLSAFGWVWLIICSNHSPRALHVTGAVIYIASLFVFTFLHSADYHSLSARIAIWTITTATFTLALTFAYFEIHRSQITYILEHSLYVMCQIMYAFFTHFPPKIE